MSNNIIKFIKGRAAIVMVFFGLFGAALQNLILKIDDKLLGDYSFALAMIFSFLICMSFSFLLRGDFKSKKSLKFKKFKKKLNLFVMGSLIASIVSGLIYFQNINLKTVHYNSFGNSSARLLKGEYKPDLDIKYLRDSLKFNLHMKSVNEEVLIHEVGGTSEDLYTPESLSQVRFELLVWYCVLIICFSALAYTVSDIVTLYYSDQVGEFTDIDETNGDNPAG